MIRGTIRRTGSLLDNLAGNAFATEMPQYSARFTVHQTIDQKKFQLQDEYV